MSGRKQSLGIHEKEESEINAGLLVSIDLFGGGFLSKGRFCIYVEHADNIVY
jgi:hypothetical protein